MKHAPTPCRYCNRIVSALARWSSGCQYAGVCKRCEDHHEAWLALLRLQIESHD
jgi:hypothetical protein